MTDTPDWIVAISSIGSLIVAIIALVKANSASNKVNSIIAQNANTSKVGSTRVLGDDNKTAIGSGNNIS